MNNRSNLHNVSIKLTDVTYKTLNTIAQNEDKSMSDVIRGLIQKGLEREYMDGSADLIANIVHKELEVVLRPSINRLAALSSKTGHAAVASMFLNVQAIMDFVPTERRKDAKDMYEKSMKKAVAYMKKPLSELTQEFSNEE